MLETGSDIFSQKQNKFYFWPAEYLRTVLDKSHSVSHHLSHFPQQLLNTILHLPFQWKRLLPVFQVLLHQFFSPSKCWNGCSATGNIYFKDIFSNTSHIYTCISAAYIHRDTSEDWVVRHKSRKECSRTVRIWLCQTIWCLCQIPHHSLRFDGTECFGEYCEKLSTLPLTLKKVWNIVFYFVTLGKVSYLFRISFMTEIDFFNWQFHRTLFFQIHLSEKIKGTGAETVHRT